MIVNIILCGVIVVQSILHYIERGKLQDRIMSRNLAEFKHSDDKAPISPKSAHRRVITNWRKVK